jgi:uncharacterized protein
MTGHRAPLDPTCDCQPYVFVSVPALPADLRAVATVEEPEGLTVVLSKAEADRIGLAYGFVAARITLALHSELDAVGLTAAVSAALAASWISCNVVAGAHHDHLFVPFDRAGEALAILRALDPQIQR